MIAIRNLTPVSVALTLSLLIFSAGCETAEKKATDAHADAVEAVIQTKRDSFRECYGKNAGTSAPGGRVLTTFWIQGDGHVSDARVKETTLNSPKVEACILGVLKTIRFPVRENDTGVTEVNYPFMFNRP